MLRYAPTTLIIPIAPRNATLDPPWLPLANRKEYNLL